MKKVLYWEEKKRLVYLDEKATPEFWDARWESEGKPAKIAPRDDVFKITPKFLEPGAKILEGGCGRANKVAAIVEAGFDAIGIDFAEETVDQARRNYPNLDIRTGDVRSLNFPDDSFDGYWSFGVIEHFWTGYDDILAEAARVLRPRGYLFLTAPWLSPYRQRKARKGLYPTISPVDEPDSFYQFGLCRQEVCASLERHGFELRMWRGRASEISMRDDMSRFSGLVKWLLGSRGSIPKRAFRRLISVLFNPYCGHTFLAVAEKLR